jgi:hypothetical protein
LRAPHVNSSAQGSDRLHIKRRKVRFIEFFLSRNETLHRIEFRCAKLGRAVPRD